MQANDAAVADPELQKIHAQHGVYAKTEGGRPWSRVAGVYDATSATCPGQNTTRSSH